MIHRNPDIRAKAKAASIDRRKLLLGSAAMALGAAAFAGRARAFTHEPADAKTQALYNNACAAKADHAKLINDAEAAMASHQADRLRQFDINAQGVACPVCGCRVALNAAVTPAPAKN